MKYLITGDLKDVCKKCKLSVEATGIIIGINCGTCPIRTAVEVKERETGYWWCPQCKEEVIPERVTHQGYHDSCGSRVDWKGPIPSKQSVPAGLVERLREQIKCAISNMDLYRHKFHKGAESKIELTPCLDEVLKCLERCDRICASNTPTPKD